MGSESAAACRSLLAAFNADSQRFELLLDSSYDGSVVEVAEELGLHVEDRAGCIVLKKLKVFTAFEFLKAQCGDLAREVHAAAKDYHDPAARALMTRKIAETVAQQEELWGCEVLVGGRHNQVCSEEGDYILQLAHAIADAVGGVVNTTAVTRLVGHEPIKRTFANRQSRFKHLEGTHSVDAASLDSRRRARLFVDEAVDTWATSDTIRAACPAGTKLYVAAVGQYVPGWPSSRGHTPALDAEMADVLRSFRMRMGDEAPFTVFGEQCGFIYLQSAVRASFVLRLRGRGCGSRMSWPEGMAL
jgi:hypothetical protein